MLDYSVLLDVEDSSAWRMVFAGWSVHFQPEIVSTQLLC